MKKSILIVVLLVVSGFFAVMGQHFADNAKTSFGWTFWDIMTGLGFAGFLGVWFFYKGKEKNAQK